MAELLRTFDFDGCPVRTVRGTDGEPWFVARDVAEVLDLDTAAVGRTFDADERGLHSVQTPSGVQQMADDHYGTVGNSPLPMLRQVFAAAGLNVDEPLN